MMLDQTSVWAQQHAVCSDEPSRPCPPPRSICGRPGASAMRDINGIIRDGPSTCVAPWSHGSGRFGSVRREGATSPPPRPHARRPTTRARARRPTVADTIGVLIDVVHRHSRPELTVTFGTQGLQGRDPCDAAYGIQAVAVYLR